MFILRAENHTKNIKTISEQNADSVMLQHKLCAVKAKTETINKSILKNFKNVFRNVSKLGT
jgi:hypothetical protein